MSISQEELDGLILEAVKPWGTKVAAVMGHVDLSLKARGLHDEDVFDEVERRLQALVDAGRLHADGDLSEWRASEVSTSSRS